MNVMPDNSECMESDLWRSSRTGSGEAMFDIASVDAATAVLQDPTWHGKELIFRVRWKEIEFEPTNNTFSISTQSKNNNIEICFE